MNLWNELKRRNVIRMAVLYVVAAWLLLQVADVGMSVLGLPEWTGKLIFLLLGLGFPLVLIFSWIFELTPEGIKRESEVDRSQSVTPETGRKINVLTSVLVVVGLIVVVADRFMPAPTRAPASAVAPVSSQPQPSAGDVTGESAGAAGTKETSGPPPHSVAVLPFVNMSGDKDNEYFADGLAEEVLNVLAGIRGLNVAARTSSFTFKDSELKLPDIARELNVGTVLEGSVRRAGDKVRVTAQLIKAADGYHLWSETYDRELTDVFAIQSDIAEHVARAMEVTLLGGGESLDREGTTSPEAYDAYLRGQYLLHQGFAEATVREALEAFRSATEQDPTFAPAWAGVGDALGTLISMGGIQPVEGWPKVREALNRARAIDPDLPETLALQADMARVDLQWRKGLELNRRAVELRPGSADLLRSLAPSAARMGLAEEAIDAAKKAVELDPLNVGALGLLTSTYADTRQWSRCEATGRRVLELDADRPGAKANLGSCLMEQGRAEEALDAIEGESLVWARLYVTAIASEMLGRREDSRAAYDELEHRFGDAAAYQLAEIQAVWGNADRAFEWLDRAIEARDPGISYLLVDTNMDSLRGDPRFARILERAGLGDFPRPDFVPAPTAG